MDESSSSGRPVIDLDSFKSMVEEYRNEDEHREAVIKRSRDVQKLSKQAIFSLHRGNMSQAEHRLGEAVRAARELSPIVSKWPKLRTGSFANALEEYTEAVVFQRFLLEGRLMSKEEIQLVEMEEYLGGVLDFTGELLRYSVFKATERNVEAVKKCRDLVESLMGLFLEFDFRNNQLRKKYDGLKYTLSKMENTLYELSLTGSVLKKEIGREHDIQQPGE